MALGYNRKYNTHRGLPVRADLLDPVPFSLEGGVVKYIKGQDENDDTAFRGDIVTSFGNVACIVENPGVQFGEALKAGLAQAATAIVDFGPSVWEVDVVAISGARIAQGDLLRLYTSGANAGKLTNAGTSNSDPKVINVHGVIAMMPVTAGTTKKIAVMIGSSAPNRA